MADAFFRFSNNIEENAAEIQRGLQRITTSLASARGGDTRMFDGVVRAAEQAAARANAALAKAGTQIRYDLSHGVREAGGAKDLKRELDTQIRAAKDAARTVAQTRATELGLRPGETRELVRTVQRQVEDQVRGTHKRIVGEIARDLKLTPEQFARGAQPRDDARRLKPLRRNAQGQIVEQDTRPRPEQLRAQVARAGTVNTSQAEKQLRDFERQFKQDVNAAYTIQKYREEARQNEFRGLTGPGDVKEQRRQQITAKQEAAELEKQRSAAYRAEAAAFAVEEKKAFAQLREGSRARADAERRLEKHKEREARREEAHVRRQERKATAAARETRQRSLYQEVTEDPTYRKVGQHWVGPKGVYRVKGAGLEEEERDVYRDRARRRDRRGFLANARSGFLSGGFGDDENPGLDGFARSFGQTAKFSLLYDSLNMVQQAFTDTIAEAVDYRESLTDLNLALGEGEQASQAYVAGLTDVARIAGANVGEALDSAARGIRAFAESDAPRAEKDAIGLNFADAASQAAIITDKTLADARGDIIAIATSFDLTAGELQRVNDTLAGSKAFGGDPKQIAQGLANGGIALKEAGFSLDEAGAVLSIVTARLDQSGQATATRLSRITSSLASTAGRNLLSDLNIDPNADPRDQISELAQNYERYNRTQQDRILSVVGGTSNKRELQVLLNELGPGGGLEENFASGVFNNGGRGAEQFNRKAEDLAGTLREIGGTLRAIQNGIFDAGVFAPFGLALKVAEPLLTTINDLITAYNRLWEMIPGGGGAGGGLDSFLKNAIALYAEYRLAIFLLAKMRGTDATAATGQAVAENRNLLAKTRSAGASVNASVQASKEAAQRGVSARAVDGETVAVERNTAARLRNAMSMRTAGLRGAAAGAFDLLPGSQKGERRPGLRGALGTTAGMVGAATIGIVGIDMVAREFGQASKAARDALNAEAQAMRNLHEATNPEELKAAAEAMRAAANANDEAGEGFFGTVRDWWVTNVNNETSQEEQARRNRAAAGITDRRAREEEAFYRDNPDAAVTEAFGNISNVDQVTAGLQALDEAGVGASEKAQMFLKALRAIGEETAGGMLMPNGQVKFARDIASGYVDTVTQALADAYQARTLTSDGLFEPDKPGDRTGEYRDALGQNARREDRLRRQFEADEVKYREAQLNPETYSDQDLKSLKKKRDESRRALQSSEKARARAVAMADAAFSDNPEKLAEVNTLVAQKVQQYIESQGLDAGGTLTPEQMEELAQQLALLVESSGLAGNADSLMPFLIDRLPDLIGSRQADGSVTIDQGTSAEYQRRLLADADALYNEAAVLTRDEPLAISRKLAQLVEGLALADRSDTEVIQEIQLAIIEAGRELRAARAESVTAFEAAGIDPRDSQRNAAAEVNAARRELSLAEPGTTEYYNALNSLHKAQVAYADTVVEQQAAAAFIGVDVRDDVGQARAQLEASRIRLEALRKGVTDNTSMNDFDTAGNPAGTVDVVGTGTGVGGQFIKGILNQNYFDAGVQAATALIDGIQSASLNQAATQPITPPTYTSTPAISGRDEVNDINEEKRYARDTADTRSTPPATPELAAFLRAIAQQESGGSYDAVGVKTKSGTAYGKYQILDTNIPKWSKEHLGRQISTQEFLNSPDLQEKIAQGQLTKYFNQYGAAGAASAWYSGQPGNVNSTKAQHGGPSVAQYVQEVLRRMGQGGGTALPTGSLGIPNPSGNNTVDWLKQVAATAGIAHTVTSTTGGKHAKNSLHYSGNAIDISSGNDPARNSQLAAFLYTNFKSSISELIHQDARTGRKFGVKNGQDFDFGDDTFAAHRKHVHFAATKGQIEQGGGAQGLATSSAEVIAQQQQYDRDFEAVRQAELRHSIAVLRAATDPNNSLDKARANLRAANATLRAQLVGSTGYYEAVTAVREAQLELSNALRGRQIARESAEATRAGSQVASSAAALRAARAELAAQAPRTAEFYRAQEQLYRAQADYAESLRAASRVDLSLATDITNPMLQAENDLRVARRKQRENIAAGKDQDVRDQDELDVRTAANNAEAVAFNQRLNDARTSYELQRSTQQQYIAYLRAEQARLMAITNKTYQQQQQQDQITRELMNMNKQLTGQWNLGDITMPTVYDVRRRYKQEQMERDAQARAVPGGDSPFKRIGPGGPRSALTVSPAVGTGAFAAGLGVNNIVDNSVSNVNVVINGGDINAVKQVLAQYLGTSAFQRAAVSTPKV